MVHGTNEQPGSDTLGKLSLLQTVRKMVLPPSSDSVGEVKPKYQRLKTENQNLKTKNQNFKTGHQNLRLQNSELWSANQTLKSRIEQLNRVLEWKEGEHKIKLEEKEAHLEQKEVEPAKTEKTLCMYGNCSETYIKNRVGEINTKIQSFSNNLARQWIKDDSKQPDGGGDQQAVDEKEEVP